ncbi:MAG: CvpA family protein [Pirellulaceae bacterium]
MQVYDLVMLIVLCMATIFGAIKGFAWQVASLASILVSYGVAYRFRFDVAEMIQAAPPWNQFLAMLILYVGTSFVIWVGFRLLSGVIDKVRLKEFDRHLGAAFGLLKGAIFCLLITMFAMSLLGKNQQAAICQSKSGYYIAGALDRSVGILPKEIHDIVGPYLANLDDKLKQGRDGSFVDNGETNLGGDWVDTLRQNLPGQLPSLPQDIAGALPNLPSLPSGNGGANPLGGLPGQDANAAGWPWSNGQSLPPNGGLPTSQPNFGIYPSGPNMNSSSTSNSTLRSPQNFPPLSNDQFGAPTFGAPPQTGAAPQYNGLR